MNLQQILNKPIASLQDCLTLCEVMKELIRFDYSGKVTNQIHEFTTQMFKTLRGN